MTDHPTGQPTAPPRPAPPVTVTTDRNPYGVLAAVGFALSFFVVFSVVALVLSIIAQVKSRHIGLHSRLATAGIALSATGVLIGVLLVGTFVHGIVDAAQTCARLGTGVHVLGDTTYTCTPTSFHSTTGL